MDYRTRRLEQRRQQRLGCFILATAVVAAIILASIIMAFLPPIPIAATIASYVLAVLIAGAIEREPSPFIRLSSAEGIASTSQIRFSRRSTVPVFNTN